MADENYIKPKARNLIRQVLTTKEYSQIASKAGFSLSTANNIINGLTQLNDNNTKLYKEMVKATKVKITKLVRASKNL